MSILFIDETQLLILYKYLWLLVGQRYFIGSGARVQDSKVMGGGTAFEK